MQTSPKKNLKSETLPSSHISLSRHHQTQGANKQNFPFQDHHMLESYKLFISFHHPTLACKGSAKETLISHFLNSITSSPLQANNKPHMILKNNNPIFNIFPTNKKTCKASSEQTPYC
jgi:hypothetical protein